MKKMIFASVLLTFLFISCQSDESKINEFKEIYYNILMIREKFQDTAIANPKVRKLLSKKGYTDKSFKEYSMELFTENPDAFTAVIDSVKTKAEQKLLNHNKERLRQDSINRAKAEEKP